MWLAPLLVLLATPVVGSPSLPGAAPFPADLTAKLRQAVVDQGKDYRPRTEHLNPDGSPKYTNRLILEASPYLLQHAHNPVNWYPWGDEAFERARAEGKPVLLSVGYSTCHWCHVMERESFENEEIAAFLNQNYIAIKVDREQRPDIDAVYMSAVQFMTGGGGWPMTVWLTPERKPFYGGTYLPPHDGDRGIRLGFLTLLQKLRSAYDQKPNEVAAAAADIVGRLEKEAAASSPKTVDGKAAMQRAVDAYRDGFDRDNGGFGGAPKFPRPVSLEFLLRSARRNDDANANEMVQQTLTAMHAGGMYDHVGGGFHRYSTDARWLVPHFEKMLYDNAQLTVAYLEAYQATGREEFATVAREILAYVEREMTASGGGFYSAADADSEGVEGKFFVWTPAEIEAVLGAECAKWFEALYGVTAEGNFDGRNILHLARPQAEVATAFGIDAAAFDAQITAACAELYAARQKRIAPHVDRKILVSWNGLMISAFARAALVLGREEYTRAATRSADFIIANLEANGRLRRSSLDGRAQGNGYLDDYAFFIQGLLDLFEATGEGRWLSQAIALQRTLDAHFWDEAAGGYFMTADDGDRLLVRRKPDDDGAEPAGNSVEMLNLLRLAEWTGDEAYRRRAARTIAAFAATIEQMPVAVPKMLSAVDFSLGPAKEIAIVLPREGGDAAPLVDVVRRSFVPNRVFVVAREGAELDEIAKVVPWLRDKHAREGKPTAYVCEGYVCALPTTRPDVLASQLRAPLAAPTPAGPVDLPTPPTHSAVDATP